MWPKSSWVLSNALLSATGAEEEEEEEEEDGKEEEEEEEEAIPRISTGPAGSCIMTNRD